MNTHHRLVALALGIFAVVSPALAQASRPPRDPIEIQKKIQKSAELQRQALQNLTDPTRAERLITDAAVELQAAYTDIVINASNMTMPDPLSGINSRKAQQALSLLQGASDILKTSRQNQPIVPTPPGQENVDQPAEPAPSRPYLDAVRSNLEQARRLTSSLVVY